MALRQTIMLLAISAIVALMVNALSPNGIPLIGNYRDLASGDAPIVPPTADEGDAPFIAIDVAQMEHSLGKVIFVDARDPAEFDCGTIPGSINIPFDMLPETDLAPYFDSALSGAALDHPMIIFCSGDECDLSLQLARNLQVVGYTKSAIFFGGAREWESNGFDVERREQCDEQ